MTYFDRLRDRKSLHYSQYLVLFKAQLGEAFLEILIFFLFFFSSCFFPAKPALKAPKPALKRPNRQLKGEKKDQKR